MNGGRFGLADTVDTADGLQFTAGIEDGFDQQNVSGFDQVEAVGSRLNGNEQDANVGIAFEAVQTLLHGVGEQRAIGDAVLVQSPADNQQHVHPLHSSQII